MSNRAGPVVPQLSVILPVYNGETYVGTAIESVLNQSFGDFELIVVDGESIDRSLAIVSKLANVDPRICVLRHGSANLVRQLNYGISSARGEFLARMDADDISHPQRFEKQLRFLRQNPNIAVVGSAITLIDGTGQPIRDIEYPETPTMVAQSLQSGSALAHPAVMMRRDIVQRLGGYRGALEFAEDYDLWLRISEHFLLANLPDRLLSYRHHANKRGCIFAFEQGVHTRFAQLSAAARRAGRADPLDGLISLSVQDIGRFALPAQAEEELIFELLGPLLAASKPEDVARAEEVLELIGPRPIDRGRAARKQLELAARSLKVRRRVSAARWTLRAIKTSPLQVIAMLSSIGARLSRKMVSAARRLFQLRQL